MSSTAPCSLRACFTARVKRPTKREIAVAESYTMDRRDDFLRVASQAALDYAESWTRVNGQLIRQLQQLIDLWSQLRERELSRSDDASAETNP